ncbi:MAG: 3'-5' exonuclease domain-containing protein 2 [Bacteroidales bacterium]|nr:3'-5' exonuclease domain-containing protein 2 [Bacteroidales bacterium]
MEFLPSITPEQINKLPEFEHTGDIILVDTVKKLNQVSFELISECTWGFDTETRPNFVKGRRNPYKIALLQLSNAHTTYLFRVQKIGMNEILKHILLQEKVVKIGAAVRDDIAELRRFAKIEPKGFIDLQIETNKYGIIDNGLRNMVAIVLGKRISKSQQLSNWENETLTDKQIMYAAIDARVCYLIYKKLQNIKQS